MSLTAFSGGAVKMSTCPGAPAPPTPRPVLPSRERRSLHCVTRKTIKGCLLSKCRHETFIRQLCNAISSFLDREGDRVMLCTGIYPCAEGMLRVLKNALEQNGRPSAANGVGDVTPRPALGSGQSCSLLPAVAGGREQPESPPRQGGCPGQPIRDAASSAKGFSGLGVHPVTECEGGARQV